MHVGAQLWIQTEYDESVCQPLPGSRAAFRMSGLDLHRTVRVFLTNAPGPALVRGTDGTLGEGLGELDSPTL